MKTCCEMLSLHLLCLEQGTTQLDNKSMTTDTHPQDWLINEIRWSWTPQVKVSPLSALGERPGGKEKVVGELWTLTTAATECAQWHTWCLLARCQRAESLHQQQQQRQWWVGEARSHGRVTPQSPLLTADATTLSDFSFWIKCLMVVIHLVAGRPASKIKPLISKDFLKCQWRKWMGNVLP